MFAFVLRPLVDLFANAHMVLSLFPVTHFVLQLEVESCKMAKKKEEF